jgi:hypothetical protein
MQPSTRGRLLAALAPISVASIALAACGDDDDRGAGTYETSCATTCGKIHGCDTSFDADNCTADCENDYAAIGPKVSGPYLEGIDACVAALDCSQIVASTLISQCQGESAANLSPSAEANRLCNAVQASVKECTNVDTATTSCLNGVKIFSDAALADAQGCVTKPCADRPACLTAALGIVPGG